MHAAVCDFVIDCLQNSVEAGSTLITLEYETEGSFVRVKISDNGRGMTIQELEKVRDPFYTDGIKHKKRKVGLGIPFLLQAVNQAGGSFNIESEKGRGTVLDFSIDTSEVDAPPEGDISAAVVQAMMFSSDYELVYKRTIKGYREESYIIKRSELLDALGDLETAGSIKLARQYLESQEEYFRKETCNGKNESGGLEKTEGGEEKISRQERCLRS